MLSTTAFLALAMQCATTVHPDTALEVARVESGFYPYTIAEIIPQAERKPGNNGVISHYPKSKDEALSIIDRIEKKKRRYSVWLMQITSTNFNRYGMSARDLLTPCTNLSVFEKIITDCYQRGGSMKRALSCYYAGNFSTGQKKEATFNQTSYIERIGYKKTPQYSVPRVKQDIRGNRRTLTAVASSLPKKILPITHVICWWRRYC
ncbi:MAG: lytic transglycosylase domain-containing protein [Symbiopectobacterium sp.]|uniref:lytic transglycosylase domain-containing protein n=1 Tax=Symbiopectobacterium sp. TaxID=2952789 RepID=UPI003F2A1ADF